MSIIGARAFLQCDECEVKMTFDLGPAKQGVLSDIIDDSCDEGAVIEFDHCAGCRDERHLRPDCLRISAKTKQQIAAPELRNHFKVE
ncbi:hypothetical protein [Roseibium polysiphoniae]|uniref:hypothetical protein n=1 Tax=Roseibium polysiphoniae TaxID=2571221 RepID=UPI003297DB32